MPPPAPRPVSALVFYVADLDRTARFYADVLGIGLDRAAGDDDHPQIGTAEAGPLSLVFFENADEGAGSSPIVVFGLDGGIEDAVDALVRQNVEVVAPVAEAPGGGLTADFRDPDGHTLSFHQPAGLARRLPS